MSIEQLTTGVPKLATTRVQTILVADDNQPLREVINEILDAHDYKLLLAKDGEEALRLFNENHETIDLVLSDLSMPKLNGYQLLKRIRAKRADVALILMTAHPIENSHIAQLGNEQVKLLQKPFGVDMLLYTIRLVLSQGV